MNMPKNYPNIKYQDKLTGFHVYQANSPDCQFNTAEKQGECA